MNAQRKTNDETAMHDDVIGLLVGDRPLFTDKQIYDAAIVIQSAWDELNGRDRNIVETLLAWVVIHAGNLPALYNHAHARASSSFSLRNPVVRSMPASVTGGIELIETVIAEARQATAATQDGSAHARLTQLLAKMQAAYPALHLSFGYIGNCDLMSQRWDDRSWKYFTKLATADSFSGMSNVSYGGFATSELGRMMIDAERDFPAWCAAQQAKLESGELRSLV